MRNHWVLLVGFEHAAPLSHPREADEMHDELVRALRCEGKGECVVWTPRVAASRHQTAVEFVRAQLARMGADEFCAVLGDKGDEADFAFGDPEAVERAVVKKVVAPAVAAVAAAGGGGGGDPPEAAAAAMCHHAQPAGEAGGQ